MKNAIWPEIDWTVAVSFKATWWHQNNMNVFFSKLLFYDKLTSSYPIKNLKTKVKSLNQPSSHSREFSVISLDCSENESSRSSKPISLPTIGGVNCTFSGRNKIPRCIPRRKHILRFCLYRRICCETGYFWWALTLPLRMLS